MSIVSITDYTFPDLSIERELLETADNQVIGTQAKTPEEAIAAVANADVVITQFAPIDARVVGAMNSVKVIVRYGIGVDNVDLKAAKSKGIPVCNVPDYCIEEVADHTLALTLGLTRRVVENAFPIRNGEWKIGVPLHMLYSLRDLSVGVVGFGRIGRAVTKRLLSFGCKVLVFDPITVPGVIAQSGATSASLDQIIAESDVLTLHCPSTSESRGFIDKPRFDQMKKGVLLVNTSRGDLVVTDDLVEALLSGQVSGAALDVTNPEPLPVDCPLRDMPQVIIHAHIASASVAAVRRLRQSAAHHALRALRGEKPMNVVNGL